MPEITKAHTGTVRLVDRKTRVVEVLGPQPLGSRRPTDQRLLFDQLYGRTPAPTAVAHCFSADDREARFIVDAGRLGDEFLDHLTKRTVVMAKPYGVSGWKVEG